MTEMNVGDRVMRSNADYGVMVGTIIELATDHDQQGRLQARVKWDGGVRTWNLASVLQPLDQAGYATLARQSMERSRRYQIKHRYGTTDLKRNMERQQKRYEQTSLELFGRGLS